MLVFNLIHWCKFYFPFFFFFLGGGGGGGGGGLGGMVMYENKFETKLYKIKTESKIINVINKV